MSAALPNILTAARLIAVPVMVLLLLVDGGNQTADRWWALAVFLVAGATDFLDGYLARRWAVVSTFGKLADPIADKVLILAALAMIAVIGDVGWWIVVVLAVREIAVTVGRLMVAADTVIPASRGGKLKTVLQIVSISFFLAPVSMPWVDPFAYALLIASVILALVTGYDYMRRIAAVRRRQRAGHGGHQESRPDVAA